MKIYFPEEILKILLDTYGITVTPERIHQVKRKLLAEGTDYIQRPRETIFLEPGLQIILGYYKYKGK